MYVYFLCLGFRNIREKYPLYIKKFSWVFNRVFVMSSECVPRGHCLVTGNINHFLST